MPRPRRRTPAALFFFLLACSFAFPQETRFAVIADTHVGAGKAASELEAIVARINGLPGIAFVVIAGDITEKGGPAEFVEARKILDKLAAPYYALPGNHDSHWIGYGLAGFRDTWPEDKFVFQKNKTFFIGIHGWDMGNVSPQDLEWLERRVSECPLSSMICLFIHQPLNFLDNGFAVSNILRGRKAYVISGHVHRNEEVEYNGIPGATIRAAISSKTAGWGFGLVRDTPEDFYFYEVGETHGPELWGITSKTRPGEVPEVRRPQFENFGVEILWLHDLKTRLSASLAAWNDLIYAADDSGKLTCFGADGKALWSFEAGASLVARPAVFGSLLWAARGSRVLKLEAKTGRLLNSGDIMDYAQSQLTVFPFRDGQKLGLLVGTRSGKMICLDAGSLKILWQNDDASGAIQTRPLVVAGKVIFGSWDGRLYCLDAASGRRLWTWTENANFYYSPAGCIPQSDGKNVFVCAPDGYVSSVGLDSGKTLWRKKYDGWESIGLTEDRKKILVKSRTDEFNILGTENGALVQKISPAHGGGDIIPGEPVEWQSSIIFGAQNGFVYRIDRSGRMSPLLFLGTAGVQTVLHLKDDLFAASNVDGRIAVFRIRPKG